MTLTTKVVIGIAIACVVGIALEGSGGSNRPAAPQVPTDTGALVNNNTVCSTRAAMERAVELSDDVQAFGRFVLDPSNGCTSLPAGTRVVIEEIPLRGPDLRRFHARGDARDWWTTKGSIGW